MEARSYQSPRRAQAAAATRRAVLDAALALFEADGYGGTVMSDVAARADVSLNTVYTSVGSKPELLIALLEDASEDGRIGDTLAALAEEGTPEKAIALIAAGTRAVFEANGWLLGILYDIAATDPQVAAATRDVTERYRGRIQQAAQHLDSLDRLLPGLTVDKAGELLWFYFGYRPWRDLRDMGWQWDEAQSWLTSQAIHATIAP
jgi:AcrR family transcriptional regulator